MHGIDGGQLGRGWCLLSSVRITEKGKKASARVGEKGVVNGPTNGGYRRSTGRIVHGYKEMEVMGSSGMEGDRWDSGGRARSTRGNVKVTLHEDSFFVLVRLS